MIYQLWTLRVVKEVVVVEEEEEEEEQQQQEEEEAEEDWRRRRRRIRTKRIMLCHPLTHTYHVTHVAVAVVHWSHLLKIILMNVYILQERTVDHTHQFREVVLTELMRDAANNGDTPTPVGRGE